MWDRPTTTYANTIGDRDCFQIGMTDGENYPFYQETYGACEGDCYNGLLVGCMSVNGNAMEEGCEISTDE